MGMFLDEALGMLAEGHCERLLSLSCDDVNAAEEDIGRSEEVQALVVMGVVIPIEEVDAPTTTVACILEAAWIVGLVFERMEVRFRERIVVRHPWPRVASVDAELCKQLRKPVRGHRRAAVLVDQQLARFDSIAIDGPAKSCLASALFSCSATIHATT